MKYTRILAAFLGALCLLSSSCGTGDKIGSVSMTAAGVTGGFVNINGLGGTIQLQVTANYTSGKMIDETNFATYTVVPEGFYWTYDGSGNPASQIPMSSPPQTFTLDKTGMGTAVDPAVCSWVNLGTFQTPGWAYTGYYEVTATYRGFTSNPVFIPIASAASGANNTQGMCGPGQTQ